METDLRNEEPQHGSNAPSDRSPWATISEAAAYYRRSEWFIRKVATTMSKRKVDRHPIKAGRDWLIDIGGMTDYFSEQAVQSSSETSYPITEVDGNLPDEIDSGETWGWDSDVA
jgi:hypothetical protein